MDRTATGEWNPRTFIETALRKIERTVGAGEKVLCAVSGGLDSMVVAFLLDRAVGDRLVSVFVDHGLLRLGEAAEVTALCGKNLQGAFHRLDARDRFLKALRGAVDPEQKRRIIGAEFISLFREKALSLGDISYLAQGTIRSDVIESGAGPDGQAIKAHHNAVSYTHLDVYKRQAQMGAWEELVHRASSLRQKITVALVGKYTAYPDAYLSVNESLFHAGWANNAAIDIRSIQAEDFETGDPDSLLQGVHAVLVPGGFGHRGIEGKISAVRVAREKKIPFLGLCLGMQCAVIEFARHVAGLEGAHSTEFDTKTPHPVFDYLPGQDNNTRLGGTLRLGAHSCMVKEGTLARKVYGEAGIVERHRHRFEFNNDYCGRLEAAGMIFSGINEQTGLVEMIELPGHPWFMAVLFHPEFRSRPQRPHPLFRDFIAAAINESRGR